MSPEPQCEGYKRGDGKLNYRCPGGATTKVWLMCVHEHLISVDLCDHHSARADDGKASCIFCASKQLSGEHHHRFCRMNVIEREPLLAAAAVRGVTE